MKRNEEFESMEMGTVYGGRMQAAGVDKAALIERANTLGKAKKLEKEVKIDHKKLHHWAKKLELMELVGNRQGLIDLLEAIGITEVKHFKRKKAEKVRALMKEENDKNGKMKRLPSTKEIEKWINPG